jgi:hypothetical protein
MFAKRNGVCLVILALGFVALTPADAFAYVDPGTGSYLFQLAAAGLFAGMFTLRRFWDAVKSRVTGHVASARRRNQPDTKE